MTRLLSLATLGFIACSQSSTLLVGPLTDTSDAGDAGDVGDVGDAGANDLLPVLFNFRVEDGEAQRLYFDSTELIVGTTHAGFTISEKSIAGVSVQDGSTTGHYFTVGAPFTFWDNTTIRYEGAASDIRDLEDEPVHDFYLQYVVNNIAEPTPSGTAYFVTTSGDDTATGLSEAAAWRTLGFALSGASPVAGGDIVHVRSGDYGAEQIITAKNSDATPDDPPIFVIGSQNAPGDDPDLGWSYPDNTEPDASVMPLFRGDGTGTAFEVRGDNLIFKNLQIDNYGTLFYVTSGPERVAIQNVILTRAAAGHGFLFNSEAGRQNRIVDSVVYNAANVMIRYYGTGSMIDGVTLIQDAGSARFIEIRGNGAIVRNSHLEYFVEDGFGQGLNVKGRNVPTERCLFENLDVISVGASIEASHEDVRFNVYRHINISRTAAVSRINVDGILINNGASFNVFDGIRVDDARTGIAISPGTEDAEATTTGHDNLIINSVFSNLDRAVSVRSGRPLEYFANRVLHSTFFNVGTMFVGSENARDNTFEACQFIDIATVSATPGFTFQDSNFFGSSLLPGDGNVSTDPRFVGAPAGDFHLQADAPVEVITGARTQSAARYDRDGVERNPTSSAIGPFEAR